MSNSGPGIPYNVTHPPPALIGLGWMFYIVKPSDTYFEKLDQVPDFIAMATPYFLTSIVIELALFWWKYKKSSLRFNDSFSSLSAGIYQQVVKIAISPIDVITYVWVYDNLRLYDLPWDSVYTWLLGLIIMDIGYYWFHRFAHEINILWAAHSVHHSSEEYNLTTALRQSALQGPTGWMFYLPGALFIPPPVWAVHRQFNTLYQFWIHTQGFKSLGWFLDFILNTPSHHSVHHGRNRYCIDKNYGGTFIIWDRLFGTFQAETEPVVYGLTHPLQSWDPTYTQFAHYIHICKMVWKTPGIWNKLCVIFKGPGWSEGKPRLGDINDIPDVKAPWTKYDSTTTPIMSVYVFIHFLGLIVTYQIAMSGELPYFVTLVLSAHMLSALSIFGGLFDQKKWAVPAEFARLVIATLAFFVAAYIYFQQTITTTEAGETETNPLVFLYSHFVDYFLNLEYIWKVIVIAFVSFWTLSVLFVGYEMAKSTNDADKEGAKKKRAGAAKKSDSSNGSGNGKPVHTGTPNLTLRTSARLAAKSSS